MNLQILSGRAHPVVTIALLSCALILIAACDTRSEVVEDSETHFLRCSDDTDCEELGNDYICHQDVCRDRDDVDTGVPSSDSCTALDEQACAAAEGCSSVRGFYAEGEPLRFVTCMLASDPACTGDDAVTCVRNIESNQTVLLPQVCVPPGWTEVPLAACAPDAGAGNMTPLRDSGLGPPTRYVTGVVTHNQSCSLFPVEACSADASAPMLEFQGSTPLGSPTAVTAVVTYHTGFASSADLTFYGTAGGVPFAVQMDLNFHLPVTPPRSYEDPQGTLEWETSSGQCSTMKVAAHMEIEEREMSSSSVRLRGSFTIDTKDWQFRGDFTLLEACRWVNHL